MTSDQDIPISASQCRAARALLDMDAGELASRAGIAASTVSGFETGRQQAAARTIRKLRIVLEQEGIVFTEGEGLRKRQKGLVRVIEGDDANLQIHDDIYHTLKNRGGEVLCAGVTELDASAGERFELLKKHIARLQDAGITERVLLKEGDTNFVAPREWYRWLPADYFSRVPYQIYGDKIALKDLEQKQILLIEHRLFAESQRAAFNALWDMARPVDTGPIRDE